MESTKRRLVVRATDGDRYAPANHSGTSNRRLICEETVGARKFEILAGTIQRGHGAALHTHPRLEQIGYILGGSGISEVNGKYATIEAGKWFYLPPGVFHRFTVGSVEPVELIVIYAPPYNEDAAQTMRAETAAVRDDLGPHHLPIPCPLPVLGRTALMPIIDRVSVNAKQVEVYLATIWPGLPLQLPAVRAEDQALYIQQGSVLLDIGGESVVAAQGDWMFIPPGRALCAQVSCVDYVTGFLVRSME